MLTSSSILVGCSNYSGAIKVEHGVNAQATKGAGDTTTSAQWVDVIDDTTNGGHSYVDSNGNVITPEPQPSTGTTTPPATAPTPESPVVTQPAPTPESPVVTQPAPTPESPVVTQPAPIPESPVVTQPAPTPESPVVTQPAPTPESPVVTQPAPTPESPVVTQPAPTPESPIVTQPAPTPESPIVTQPAPTPESPIVTQPAPTPEPPVVTQPAPTPESPIVTQPAPTPESPVVTQPAPNPGSPVDACLPVAQNQCGSKSTSSQCGDDGFDSSTDIEDANECLTLKGLNIAKGISSRVMPHLKDNQKNVWLTDQPITEPISGHGKLIVIYTGKAERGSIIKIDGWKGKLILCGFIVDELKKIRGKVSLINSSVKKLEYSRGRVVANLIQTIGGATQIASTSISGGLLNSGVFSVSNNKITSTGDWTKMTSESVKAKADLLATQKSSAAEQEHAIKDLQNQISTLEKNGKEKNKRAIADLNAKIKDLRDLLKDLLNLKIGFASDDDDHDCEHDSRKGYEIDIFKKWKEFAEKSKEKIKQCHKDGKQIADQAKNGVSGLVGGLASLFKK